MGRRATGIGLMLLAISMAIVGLIPVLASPRPAAAMPSPLLLPFPVGQTWYVCQGYNGQISHQGIPAFDLSISPASPGSTGCTPSTASASAGQTVTAPGAGILYQTSQSDFVCINFDAGGSAGLGHLTRTVASGAHVNAGDAIGTVNAPGVGANGGYAHIHIQIHSAAGCGTAPMVPFDDAHQARFQCAPDLPYSGAADQYSGLALTRCGGSPDPRQEGAVGISGNWVPGGRAYFTINVKNYGAVATPAIHPYIEGNGSGGFWRADGAQPASAVIQPGQTVSFTVQQDLCCSGTWTMNGVYIWNNSAGQYWEPLPANGQNQQLSFNVAAACMPSPVITKGLTVSPTNPMVGDVVTVSFDIENTGCADFAPSVLDVAVRGPGGINEDMAVQGVVVHPGATYTYSQTRAFPSAGGRHFWVDYLDQAGWHGDTVPTAGGAVSHADITVAACAGRPVVTSGIAMTPANPLANEPVTFTATIANTGCADFHPVALGVTVRLAGNVNEDPPWAWDIVIPAGQSYTYRTTRAFASAGSRYFQMLYRDDSGGTPAFPAIPAGPGAVRDGTFTVRPSASLSLSASGGGAAAASPAGPIYAVGATVTLTAAPAAGYAFAGWTVDGAPAGSANPLALTMDANHAVVAVFTPLPPGPAPSPAPTSGWSAWASQGGILTDAPAAVGFNGRVYVFARGSDRALYVKSSADGVAWTPWASQGGILTAAPAAASVNGTLFVFAKGSDNALYVKSSADGVTFTPWRSLGGVLTAPPAAAGVDGVLYVFAKGSDDGLYVQRSADGATWSGWRPLGGVLTAAPAAAGFQGRIYVFAKGSDSALYAKSSADGITWTDWRDEGGVLTGAPAAAAVTLADGREVLYTLAKGSDNALYERHTADGAAWTPWYGLQGQLAGPPAAAGAGGRLYAFAWWRDGALWVIHTTP